MTTMEQGIVELARDRLLNDLKYIEKKLFTLAMLVEEDLGLSGKEFWQILRLVTAQRLILERKPEMVEQDNRSL